MDIIIIEGGKPLHGLVRINGAKNASLPIMAASLLTEEPVIIEDVPDLIDVEIMSRLLETLGAELQHQKSLSRVYIRFSNLVHNKVPPELVTKMRASFLVIGPLLARLKKARIALPGGCAIGTRPIDLHLKGLTALGAEFVIDNGYVEAVTDGLKGAHIYLDFPSVGATENIMMAATLAEGVTVIENASLEPEIVDLANFLSSMGANITGAATPTVKIEGVKSLQGTRHLIIPDRIEAGTFMIAAATTGGKITLQNVVFDHLKSLVAKLKEAGVTVNQTVEGDIVVESEGRLRSVDITTLPYPGFPTDLQPQFSVLLAIAQGVGMMTENVFEDRFRHVDELISMGAEIKVEGKKLIIQGHEKIYGASLKATDLRAAAALVIAGLVARGRTKISKTKYLDRGYHNFDHKLRGLGAHIYRSEKDEEKKRWKQDSGALKFQA